MYDSTSDANGMMEVNHQHPEDMGNSTSAKRLEALLKKQEEVNRRIKLEKQKLKSQERKQHTTKLIAYGLLIYDDLEQGKITEEELLKRLDGVLKQNSHRLAVGLPVISKDSPQDKKTSSKKSKSSAPKAESKQPPKQEDSNSIVQGTVDKKSKSRLPEPGEDELSKHFG